ncbi:MAG: hypothetical protein KatS3mg012_2480 [Gaiellaceae bacterium]|nr:MAG: hypothetical protein KatS3mg012_2480 [Gaiellaceae bacterium]
MGARRAMATRQTRRTRVGALRPSALIHTFGVGSVVDLPRLSAMVMGLDDWRLENAPVIEEPRLLAAIRQQEGLEHVERLHGPPQNDDRGGLTAGALESSNLIGVPVAAFPRWLLCPVCRKLAPIESGLFELRVNAVRPDQNRYVHTNCAGAKSPPTALPARFVVACENGHLDDFPWVAFAHYKTSPDDVDCAWNLRLDEIGASGEVAHIQVTCLTCDSKRRLSEAFGEKNRDNMPLCSGAHPHLREREGCTLRMRAMLLGATNSWFAVKESALSIPRHEDELMQRIHAHWSGLEAIESTSDIALLRRRGELAAFADLDDEQLLAALERYREQSDEGVAARDIRVPEWELLTGDLRRTGRDFTARAVGAPAGFEDVIERVVLVERLREVQALLGFTRVDSPFDEDNLDERRVPLGRGRVTFLPAAEVHGEGIFVQLVESAVSEWVSRSGERDAEFRAAHAAWRERRRIPDPSAGYPGLRLVLVHTFAHALMRRLALECGYSQASIRERLYALPPEDPDGPMAGVLLYTAAPDSEGTLGGLVRLGEPEELGRHLRGALRDAGLCASDPLCAEHAPDDEGITLHGAACHACLFAPETSCERGNRYLDRAVLTELITGLDLGFLPRP